VRCLTHPETPPQGSGDTATRRVSLNLINFTLTSTGGPIRLTPRVTSATLPKGGTSGRGPHWE